MKKFSIRSKIFLAIILTVIVVFADTFYVLHYKSSQYLIEQARNDYLAIVRSWANEITHEIDESIKITDMIAEDIDRDKSLTYQLEMLRSRFERFHAVYAMDSRGQIIDISPHIPGFNPSPLFSYLKNTYPKFMNAKRSFILTPSKSNFKNYIFVFSRPIDIPVEGEGTKSIMLIGVIKKNYLFKRLIESSASNISGSEWLISDTGTIILGRDKELIGKGFDEAQAYFHLTTNRLNQLISGDREGSMLYEWGGKNNLIVYNRLKNPPWSLVLTANNIPPAEKLETMKKYLVAVTLFNILFAIILAGLLARGITNALHKLVTETTKIEEGDYSLSLPTGRKDEVGMLARTLKRQ